MQSRLTYRILIVEDDVDSGEALKHLLEDLGHEVRLVHYPAMALRVAAELKPQLAVLDIGLPVMSGYELHAALGALPQLEGCRFVALTGFVGPEVQQAIREAGFGHHLTKPLVFSELRAILGCPVASAPITRPT